MSQPPSFADPQHLSHVRHLKKALYGLKQAPRAWFHKLAFTLANPDFLASQSDLSLFIGVTSSSLTIVLVYVDDIIITGSDSARVSTLIFSLASLFALKDLGPLHYFLGIQVIRSPSGLHLSQPNYIHDLLVRSKMSGAKPCSSPITPTDSLSKHKGVPMTNHLLYRSTVGALQYATITLPDITFVVNKASQFMQSPTNEHWEVVKRILHYLKGTLTHGIQLHASSPLQLHAYTDSDDRRSTLGFCVFLGSNLLSWGSKKQHTVARSSTEAEYRSMTIACTELIWLQHLLQELRVPLSSSPVLYGVTILVLPFLPPTRSFMRALNTLK